MFPEFYEVSEVIDIADPEDKGRVKVKFLRTNVLFQDWIPLKTEFYGAGNNGWHGELGVGDIVLVAFIDWPNKQKPFVDGKLQTRSESLQRVQTDILKMKEHTIIFSQDAIEIKNKNGVTLIKIENGKIDMLGMGPAMYSSLRGELMKTHFDGHFHICALGYPTTTPMVAGYIWNEQILNKNVKID